MTTEKELTAAEQEPKQSELTEKAKRQAARDEYAASCRADRDSRQGNA